MTDPFPDPAAPWSQPVRRPHRHSRSVWAALLVAVAVSALGLGVGWIWATLAPRVAVLKTDTGFVYADPEPEQAVAGDGWFAILGLAVGLVLAVLVWLLLRRHRGVAVLVGLTLGSIVGAGVTWWVGHKIGFAQFEAVRDSAAVGARVDAPLGLRITDLDTDQLWPPAPTGVAAVQALVAAFAYTTLAGFSPYPDLRRPDPQPEWPEPSPGWMVQDQFGPGFTGSSDGATGTART